MCLSFLNYTQNEIAFGETLKHGAEYARDESLHEEFKLFVCVSAEHVKKLVRTIEMNAVSFMDSRGGRILFGVREDGIICGFEITRFVLRLFLFCNLKISHSVAFMCVLSRGIL